MWCIEPWPSITQGCKYYRKRRLYVGILYITKCPFEKLKLRHFISRCLYVCSTAHVKSCVYLRQNVMYDV